VVAVYALAGLAVLLVLASMVRVSRAEAAFIHPNPPSEAFGTDGTAASEWGRGGALAINPVSQRLYAYENQGQLYGFDISGPGVHTPLGGRFPVNTANTEKSGVAVDPITGNVYTTDKRQVLGFTAEGEALPGFPVTAGLAEPCGISTDAEGNFWVGDLTEKQIREYNAQGELLRAINASSVYEPEFGYGMVCTIAVDKSTGDLYFTLSENYGANRIVWRLRAADGYAPADVEEFVVNPTYPGITGISIDSSRHAIYLSEGSRIREYNTSGVLLDEFATATEPVNAVIDEQTGNVYVTVSGFSEPKHQIQVYEPEIVPDALTGDPTGDSQVSGTVGTAGGPAVTECKFEWGPTAAYGEAPVACSPGGPYGDSATVTANLPGLTKESTYHYRLVATNENGTNIGIDRTITPHYVPFIRTTAATAVERTCATLNGAYDGNGEDTHYNFEWGTTTAYGNSAFPSAEDGGSGSGPQTKSFQLCNLQPATTYHYRFTASNGSGPSVGGDVTFTTKTAVIGLSTDPATAISGVAATLNGHWTGDGTPTTYHFEWGFSKNYANSTPPVDAGTSSSTQTGSASLAGLFQNTVYHYRIVVTDGLGTTYGADRTFRTLILAAFTYQPTNKLTTTSAELHATVNPENAGPTTYHFEYGPTESYGTQTPESGPVGSDKTAHPVAAAISGLSPGQTYHFRIVATSPAGISDGPDQTFTAVPNLPTVVGESASGITDTEATLTAEARPGFGPTVIFFRYGTGNQLTAHTVASSPIGSDDSAHAASLLVKGLLPGTTYVYRAVAVNVAGSDLGPAQSFTTADSPSAEISPVAAITETTATLAGIVSPNRAATAYHFEYRTDASPWASTAATPIGSDEVPHEVSSPIAGLTPGTQYHYRLVAVNSVGTSVSREGDFATSPAKARREVPQTKCRKHFVKKHGKCVKKPRKKKHKKSRKRGHRHG
jgi:phosphodiesterase/alkaline phosphatase D-like protein